MSFVSPQRAFRIVSLLSLSFVLLLATRARAQGMPTAEQQLRLSAFGTLSGTWTGLNSYNSSGGSEPVTVVTSNGTTTYIANGPQGRNLALTAGVDLGFMPYRFIRPSLEVRGSFPVDDGQLDSQRNILAGLRFNVFNFALAQPYVDAFYGRGQVNYAGNGYPVPGQDYTYIVSDGNVFAFGGGAEVPTEGHFALKLDFQLQRYSVPVTTSGSIYAKSLSAGITYRFDFNHHPK